MDKRWAMATELQFVAIAAFLIWCLVSSLCGVLRPEPDAARLVFREHGPGGWRWWREVHFGLTAADAQGGKSSFNFSNFKENVGLADKMFQFTIPRGTEVISSGKTP